MEYPFTRAEGCPLIFSNNNVYQVSHEFIKLSGYSEDELIGKTLTELSSMIRIDSQVSPENTEEKAKNKMEEALKMQNELLANISHEFKTPLSIISSATQLIETYLDGDSIDSKIINLSDKVNMIKENCNRLTRLVNNVLELSKIDSGHSKLNLSNENIVRVIEDMVQSLSDYIEGKQLSIIFDTDTEEKMVAIDVNKIERVILNLISNAVKFSNPGDEITVTVVDKDEMIEIFVQDTGIGIEEKHLNFIFDRFYQADRTYTRYAEGSGIGLCLVKTIVEMHGGEISVQSEVGKGSIFKICLPVRVIDNTNDTKRHKHRCNTSQLMSIEFSDIY